MRSTPLDFRSPGRTYVWRRSSGSRAAVVLDGCALSGVLAEARIWAKRSSGGAGVSSSSRDRTSAGAEAGSDPLVERDFAFEFASTDERAGGGWPSGAGASGDGLRGWDGACVAPSSSTSPAIEMGSDESGVPEALLGRGMRSFSPHLPHRAFFPALASGAFSEAPQAGQGMLMGMPAP